MEKIQSKKKISSTFVVLLLDMFISVAASVAAILYVRWQTEPVLGFEKYLMLWVLIATGASLLGFLVTGNYKIVIRHSSIHSISKLIYSTLIKEIVLSIVIISFSSNKVTEHWPMLIIADLLFTLVFLILMRIVIIDIYSSLQNNYETNVKRVGVIVFGTSDKSIALVTRLIQSPNYNVLGFLSRDKADGGQIRLDHKVYYFENEDDIRKLKINLGIEGLLFAKDSEAESEKDGLIPICLHLGIHILTAPRIEEVDFGGMSSEAIKDVVDNDFIPDGMSNFERNLKRLIDFILAAVLIIIFSPLFLICALAVKIGGGPGPVLYKQERIGRFGRPFNILKFRTMRENAEQDGPQLYSGDDDPRLTKAGKFLRQHHLDELPQLFNVFCGQMAFIGWRPERKYYIDQIMKVDPRYYYLYQIRPGVTSYATLRNGYTDSMDKMLRRLEFDLYYLRHRSAWFDMKILWLTFVNIVFGKKF